MDRFKLLGFSLVMGLVGTLSAADAGAQTAVDAGSDATVSGFFGPSLSPGVRASARYRSRVRAPP